jgi:hypothetical protein
MNITRETLGEAHDYRAEGENVRKVLRRALESVDGTIGFVARYIAWNGSFGSGVASLAGKIGRSRSLFTEEGFPAPLADRSVLVASYFFDAARDEFDDRATPYRDTHRCLAQACLAGLVEGAKESGEARWSDRAHLEEALADPAWLTALRQRVAQGYGVGSPDDRPSVFGAIGYHLGSELLADREFSVIDQELRESQPSLVADLSKRTVTIAGQEHRAYQWLEIHSGHGGAAEHDHFEWALEGVAMAFRFVPKSDHAALEQKLFDGYRSFARDQREFFDRVEG